MFIIFIRSWILFNSPPALYLIFSLTWFSLRGWNAEGGVTAHDFINEGSDVVVSYPWSWLHCRFQIDEPLHYRLQSEEGELITMDCIKTEIYY